MIPNQTHCIQSAIQTIQHASIPLQMQLSLLEGMQTLEKPQAFLLLNRFFATMSHQMSLRLILNQIQALQFLHQKCSLDSDPSRNLSKNTQFICNQTLAHQIDIQRESSKHAPLDPDLLFNSQENRIWCAYLNLPLQALTLDDFDVEFQRLGSIFRTTQIPIQKRGQQSKMAQRLFHILYLSHFDYQSNIERAKKLIHPEVLLPVLAFSDIEFQHWQLHKQKHLSIPANQGLNTKKNWDVAV